MMQERNNEKKTTTPLPDRALGPAADEFSRSSTGAGEKLGEAASISADLVLTAAKTVKALLAPVRLVVYAYDQLESRFLPLVYERLARIPEQRRQMPPLAIAGPVVEAAKFALDEPELSRLFANLLASSMDATTAQNAHPAFVEIIKQLSPDEARILQLFTSHFSLPVIELRRAVPGKGTYKSLVRNINNLTTLAKCEHPHLTQSYIDNLCRLQLCEIPVGIYYADRSQYEPVVQQTTVQDLIKKTEADEGVKVEIDYQLMRVTNFGRQFIRACVIDKP